MPPRKGTAPRKPTPTQAEVIRDLITRERVVVVEGATLKLRVPDVAAAQAVRQQAIQLRDTDQGDEVAASLLLAGAAVAACVAGVDNSEDGARLVLVTGGEVGELAQTALTLCGLGGTMQRVADGDADRPT